GPGADRLAVSGNDATRVFQISSDVNVTIDGLTVTHGRADIGGGVWNDGGSLCLTNAVISHNRAIGASGAESWGGGISNTGGSLLLSHVLFADNQAFGTPGQTAYGGAVYNQVGSLTVTHSTFTHNVAVGGRRLSASLTPSGAGGAIANRIGGTPTPSHNPLTANQR